MDRLIFKPSTIEYFTGYHSDFSRRAIAVSINRKKDNATRKEPYPCLSVSPQTFGHTGFTGRASGSIPNTISSISLYPTASTLSRTIPLLSRLNIRGRIQETGLSVDGHL